MSMGHRHKTMQTPQYDNIQDIKTPQGGDATTFKYKNLNVYIK